MPENVFPQTIRIWWRAFQASIYGLGDTLALRHLTTLLANIIGVFPHVLQTPAMGTDIYVTWEVYNSPIV